MIPIKYNIKRDFIEKLGFNELQAFYYVYGVLHSPDFRAKYANNLRKELPRIPILKDKDKYVQIGEKLAYLHLNYESVEAYSEVAIEMNSNPSFKVNQMKHPKRGMLDTIVYNNDIKIKNIPEKAYEYIINGKPAIGWIMDQYKVKVDKNSGITDDPNEYSKDEKYIFNLLLSIINVSIQTVDLMNSLPPLIEEDPSV